MTHGFAGARGIDVPPVTDGSDDCVVDDAGDDPTLGPTAGCVGGLGAIVRGCDEPDG